MDVKLYSSKKNNLKSVELRPFKTEKEIQNLGKLKQIKMTNRNSRKRSTFLKKLKRNLNLLENGLYRNPFQEG